MAKKEIVVPKIANPDELEASAEFELGSPSITAECRAHFSPEVFKQISLISYYLSKVGLTLEESCTLANVDIEKFKLLIETDELAKRVVGTRELDYKKELLYTVSARARAGDDKLAQWLLERRFPEFASGRNKQSPEGEMDMLAMAVQFIQKSGDKEPLVKETSGRAIIVRKKTIAQRIGDILK